MLHSARGPDDVIFGGELRYIEQRFPSFRLHEQHTATMGRMAPDQLDELCPDWRERETFASGPGPMLDALTEHWERSGTVDRLHMERFQPKIGGGEGGEGGTITFLSSDARSRPTAPSRSSSAARRRGLCCRSAAARGSAIHVWAKLRSGRVRDLRNGQVCGQEGETWGRASTPLKDRSKSSFTKENHGHRIPNP